MLKVQIDLDIAKIVSENKYSQDSVAATVGKAFSNKGMLVSTDSETGKIIVTDNGHIDDYGKLWSVIWELAEKSWFVENIKEWLWFNNNEGDDSREDILSFLRTKKVGV